MKARGTPFRGVLFAGLMITDTGPQLIEYNVRFGDPECEVLMPRLLTDLVALLEATVDGTLSSITPAWREEAALTVVLAARGYPGKPETGTVIEGVEDAGALENTIVFHAGTKRRPDGALVAGGGRVLAVTGLGKDIAAAQRQAYAAVDAITWPGGFCRRDIGWRAV
jgi:phosphoribosylamine--glycine ligase